MTTYFAEELTAPEFKSFITAQTVGILPVAAIEPSGPHLPLSTACDIARGHLAHVADVVDAETDVLILPLQTIGHSAEPVGTAGVFAHSAETLLRMWMDVAATFGAAGGRRLLIISSAGGNAELAGLLAMRLRPQLGMLAVSASWQRFGYPEGLFDPREFALDGHGGEVATSLMQHYWPEAVRSDKLQDLPSAASAWEAEWSMLSAHGQTRPAWLASDLNQEGAVGNAAAATAEKGAAVARHQLHGLGELIADIAAFDLSRLGNGR